MKLENRFTVPAGVDTAWAVLLDVERIAPCMPGATLTEVNGDEFTGKVKVKLGPINLTYGGTARFVSTDPSARVAVIEGSGKETRGTGTAKALITCRLVERGPEETDVEVDTDLSITGKPAQFGRGVLADVSGKLVDQFAACLAEEIGSDAAGAGGGEAEPAAAEQGAAEPAEAAGAGAATDGAAAPTPRAGSGVGAGAEGAASVEAVVTADAQASPAGAGAPGAAAPPAAAPTAAAPAAAPAAARPAAPRPRKSAEAIDLLDTAGAPVAKRALPVLAALLALVVVVRLLRRRR